MNKQFLNDVTVFVITRGEGIHPCYIKCLDALSKQTVNFHLDIIKGYSPLSLAFQQMIDRCYDKETEILTNHGWKYFKDLKGDELVANLDSKTNNVIYSPIKKLIKYQFNGELHHYKTKTVDLMITPNHNLWGELVTLDYRKSYGMQFIESQKLNNNSFIKVPRIFKNKSIINNSTIKIENISKKQNKNKDYIYNFLDWAELLGWFLSEGYLIKTKNNYKGFGIVQKKYKKEIELLLKRLNIHYYIVYNKIVPDCVTYRIYNESIAHHFLKYCGETSTKHIPQYIKNSTPIIINSFLKSYILGDGSIHSKISYIYTSSQLLANDLSEVALKSEKYWASISYIKPKKCTIRNKTYQSKGYYCINLTNHTKYSLLNTKRKKLVNYNDFVYCVETNTGIILTKRNGKILWCGNCNTKYYVEVDEDMILYSTAIESMYQLIQDTENEISMLVCQLFDTHYEIPIQGIKIYKHEICKNYPYNLKHPSCEVEQSTRMMNDGYSWLLNESVVGEHSPIWTKELIYKRYKNLVQKQKLLNAPCGYGNICQKISNKLGRQYNNLDFFALLGASVGQFSNEGFEEEKNFKSEDKIYNDLNNIFINMNEEYIPLNILFLYDVPGWVFEFECRNYKLFSSHNVIIKQFDKINENSLENINILIIPGSCHYKMLKSKGLILKAKEKGIKIIVQYNSELELDLENPIAKADLLIASSERIKEKLLSMTDQTVIFIPHFINSSYWKSYNKWNNFTLGWVGNPTLNLKRYDILQYLSEFNIITKTDWGKQYFKEGRTQDDMVEFYNNIDILLITSKSEGTPMPLLESMSCGKCIISVPCGIVENIINKNFIIYPSKTFIEDFKNKLKWLKKYPEIIQNEGKRNREFVINKLEWYKNVSFLDNLYRNLINNKS